MVYIRKKSIRGTDYLYLVKSVWDKKEKTSRQLTIKYLGESKSVTLDSIPEPFRDNPKIISFFLNNCSTDIDVQKRLLNEIRSEVFSSLINGNLEKLISIYQSFILNSNITNFYENILNPIMRKIGFMWESGEISIATEHIASNSAQSLVKIISENQKKTINKKGKIIITTPVGEEHCLSCNILESFLISKGFITYNLSPSTPGESLIEFINDVKPVSVLISITLNDNIKAGQRLAKKISTRFKNIPIYVGGQAVTKTRAKFNATIITPDLTLEQIPKILVKGK